MSVQYEDNCAGKRIANRNFVKEWFGRAENLLKRSGVLQLDNPAFINFGCSACELLEDLKNKYHIHGIAADFSETAVAYARELGYESFRFDGNNSESLPGKYAGIADFVTSTANLEHIQNLDGMLQIVNSSLKNDGVFVFTVPNSSSLENCLNSVYFGEPIDEGHHCRFLSKPKIIQLLTMNGFDVIDEEHLSRDRRGWRYFNWVANGILTLTRPLAGTCVKSKMFQKGLKYNMDFNVIEWGFSAKKDHDFAPLGLDLSTPQSLSSTQKSYMLKKVKNTLLDKNLISDSYYSKVVSVINDA